MSDTTTTLNAGSGGDSMDESLVNQADGETTAKRPRVEIALADGGSTPRLVGDEHSLPVVERDAAELLMVAKEILQELRLIRAILDDSN